MIWNIENYKLRLFKLNLIKKKKKKSVAFIHDLVRSFMSRYIRAYCLYVLQRENMHYNPKMDNTMSLEQ